MQRNGTLIALLAILLVYLKEQRTVAKRKTAVRTFSAAYAQILVDDVLEIRRFNLAPPNGIGRTQLIFGTFVSCERLRVEKARA